MINKGKICIICEDTETKTKGMCKICYSREYKKNNKEKIKPVKQKQYLRRREYFIEQSREWERNHREITNTRMRKYNKENKELKDLREKTRWEFNDLKKNGKCKDCGSKEKLEFHHLKPYRYDRFELLCRECHLEKHGRLLVRKKRNDLLVSNAEEEKKE